MANEELLYKKLDIAIERLTDVSNEIKQILVVHETKIIKKHLMLNTMIKLKNCTQELVIFVMSC